MTRRSWPRSLVHAASTLLSHDDVSPDQRNVMIQRQNESHDLSGLDVAIRLKADLLHGLGTNDPSRWNKYVLVFVAALERSHLTDTTALVVLLTELREQVRLLLGIGEWRSQLDESMPFAHGSWACLPKREILARFKEEILSMLPSAASRRALSPIVRRAKRIIDERYADPLTLERLAVAVGRSKRQLASVFRQELTMTAHEYLTRVRLRRALELIRQEEKIEAVSLLVGYRSKKNLYRHFKRHIGVTPLAYRAALFHIERPS
jgi:AraC-like DNA-binding protein